MDWLFSDYYTFENNLFFFHSVFGYPGKYSITDNCISINYNLNINKKITGDYFDSFYSSGNIVFGLSTSGKNVAIIDLKKNKIEWIEIDAGERAWGNYSCATVYDGLLFAFTRQQGKLIIINEYGNVSYQKIPKDIFYGCLSNDLIWLFTKNSNNIYSYNLKNKKMMKNTTNIIFDDWFNVALIDERIFVLDKNKILYLFDEKNFQFSKFLEFKVKDDIGKIISAGNKIITLPNLGNSIYIIDKKTNDISVYNEYPKDFSYIGNSLWSRYSKYKKIEDVYIFAKRSGNYVLFINSKTGEFIWKKPEFPSKDEILKYKYFLGENPIIEDEHGLNTYIKMINNLYKKGIMK